LILRLQLQRNKQFNIIREIQNNNSTRGSTKQLWLRFAQGLSTMAHVSLELGRREPLSGVRAALVWTFGRECNEPEHVVKPISLEIYIATAWLPDVAWPLVQQFLGWRADVQEGVLNYVYYNHCALYRTRRHMQGSMPGRC
jgi:hypothetical protein